MNDKPLVTISMMTYNQEKYVRESVRGLLSQTYEPLEIVISDDHSTDNTWDIITEEIEAYKAKGGIHTNIILNRNEKNLGISLNAQKVSQLTHGIISVWNGGDDIPFPERVEQIYQAWNDNGRKATVIINNAIKIDGCGKTIGKIRRRILRNGVFGAGTAYAWLQARRFGRIVEPTAYEDQVLSRRFRMFGDLLIIWKPLMYYRVGAGVSTVTKDFRCQMIRCLRAEAASWRQTLRDLRHVKDDLPEDQYKDLYDDAKLSYCKLRRQRLLWDGNLLSEKLKGFAAIPAGRLLGPTGVVASVLLLPYCIGDAILDGLVTAAAFMRKEFWCIRSFFRKGESNA